MTERAVGAEPPAAEAKSCFVMMPISDVDPYPPGHFARVYDHVIRPACVKAGYTKPVLASQVQTANFIMLDILKRIIDVDMVVCDLSARNPNVMYELGIRHAFNRPVTLVKDQRTPRVFDIQGLRDVDYDESLRVDTIEPAIDRIATMIQNTADGARSGTEVNSLIQLLRIDAARIPTPTTVTDDTKVLLQAIGELGDRINTIESRASSADVARALGIDVGRALQRSAAIGIGVSSVKLTVGRDANEAPLGAGDYVVHAKKGLGRVTGRGQPGSVFVEFPPGVSMQLPSDELQIASPPAGEPSSPPRGLLDFIGTVPG